MFVMYDSVTLAAVPAGPHAVACYRNGLYANEEQARRLFPHARILPISVAGAVECDCYDIETGDYSPSDVPELLSVALHARVWRPCFYANLSTMPRVVEQLRSTGVRRDSYRLWVAYYNGHTDLPVEYDAHQFTDRALGRNLDESICRDTFFAPVKHVDPTPAQHDSLYQMQLHPITGVYTLTPHR
jgi:hypothetical protein